jgi:hypothetical protein
MVASGSIHTPQLFVVLQPAFKMEALLAGGMAENNSLWNFMVSLQPYTMINRIETCISLL